MTARNPASVAERLSTLFDTHASNLYRIARRLTPTADDALDLVQDTFLRAAQSVERIPAGEGDERRWLVRVLVNGRKDQWRRQSVRERFSRRMTRAPAHADDPEAAYVDRDLVWRALDVLTPRRRAVVTLFELDGMSVTAIAALMGVSVVTVRWHLSVGRRELARVINSRRYAHERPDTRAEGRRSCSPGASAS